MPVNSPASLPPARHRKAQISGCISGIFVIGERSFNNVVVSSKARLAGVIMEVIWKPLHISISIKETFFQKQSTFSRFEHLF
jgi:hypothetical protein